MKHVKVLVKVAAHEIKLGEPIYLGEDSQLWPQPISLHVKPSEIAFIAPCEIEENDELSYNPTTGEVLEVKRDGIVVYPVHNTSKEP